MKAAIINVIHFAWNLPAMICQTPCLLTLFHTMAYNYPCLLVLFAEVSKEQFINFKKRGPWFFNLSKLFCCVFLFTHVPSVSTRDNSNTTGMCAMFRCFGGLSAMKKTRQIFVCNLSSIIKDTLDGHQTQSSLNGWQWTLGKCSLLYCSVKKCRVVMA